MSSRKCQADRDPFECIKYTKGALNKKTCRCVEIGSKGYWKGVEEGNIVPVDGRKKPNANEKKALTDKGRKPKISEEKKEVTITVKELQSQLKKIGLPVKGKKSELQDRLKEANKGKRKNPRKVSKTRKVKETSTVEKVSNELSDSDTEQILTVSSPTTPESEQLGTPIEFEQPEEQTGGRKKEKSTKNSEKSKLSRIKRKMKNKNLV